MGLSTTLAPTESIRAQRQATVLVAEDDGELLRLIAQELRRRGFQVVEARDGQALCECLGSAKVRPLVDLVVTDIHMPKASGLDALTLFGNTESPPFIVITAFGSVDTHQEAWMLGAAAVFDKPFDIDDLAAEVCRQTGSG